MTLGKESNLKGIVDIIEEKAVYNEGEDGSIIRFDEVPVDLRAQSKDFRHNLIGIVFLSNFFKR